MHNKMEGTLEQKMNTFANDDFQVVDMPILKVGNTYKITGGKWKKYKKAKVLKVNKTYSDVSLDLDCAIGNGVLNPLHAGAVKCKNCYLHPYEEVIEMPDADNLQVVDSSVDINKLYEDKQKDADAVLPVPEEAPQPVAQDVVEDITEELPSIEEALKLRKDMNKIFHYVYDTKDNYDGKVDELIGEIQHWVNHQLHKKLDIIKNLCDI